MRKTFLLCLGLIILSINGSAQTTYEWYPYGGSAAAAYAVPDASCDQLFEIENFKNKGYSSSIAGIPGREIIQFDQVSPTAGGSTYAAEYNFTCGASPVGTSSSYSNFRTEWGTGTYDNKVGKWNVNPETLEGSVGAYFWHTVNFTQTGDYKFLFRIRGNSNATTGIATNSTVVVTLYDKTNVSTPLATKTIKIDGLKYNKNTDGTYGIGLIGNLSTDESAEYAADGDLVATASQARPEWVRGTDAFNITTAGEYVVKISQTVGAGTGGIGGFTFQKVATSPTLYVNSPLTGFLTVAGAESTSKILNIAGAQLSGTGDFTVNGSTNFEVSSDNITFSESVTIPVTSVNTLAGVNVYVRVKSSASAGLLSENITVSADGGTTGATIQCTGTVNVPASYTWSGTTTDWQVATNWTPNRTSPQNTDAIIFDGTTSSVTNIPVQTIGQLKLINNADITLNNNTSGTSVTLSLSGGAGVDFSVEAGSHLKLNSNEASTTMNITLNTGATGHIAGKISMMCDETTTGSNHRINSKVNALRFVSGSEFHSTTGFAGSPFGGNNNPNGSVIFESGSKYHHSSGDVPFGGTGATNVALFENGSYYLFDGTQSTITIKPGVGGKTYGGIFEINTTNGNAVIGNSAPNLDVTYNIVKVYGTQWAIGGNTAGAITYIKGDVTVGTGGKFRFGLNPGVISPVIFNGTSPQTVLLEDNGEFNNGSGSVMTIANDVTFNGDVLINGTLNIDAGKTLTIAAGKTLTLGATAKVNNAGTITNNGTIVIQSNATDGTATIIGAGTMNGSGTANVNQSLQIPSSALRTWYVSSPVSETVSPTPALDRIKSFNETANTWSASLTQMEPKKGYLVVPTDAANNLMFTGTLNTGDQNITLTGRSGVGANQGFNLIGNPYPSYLDWSLVSAANGTSILRSATMWYRTKDAGAYHFWTVNGEGVGTPSTATNEIPPMQAFWVRAAEGGSTLTLTNTMRAHAPETNKLLKAPAVNERTLIRLQVSNGVNSDEAVIYFSENAQNGIDKLDAPKMSNDNVEIPEIYTTLGTEKIVINSMNSIPMDTPIGLGFVAGSANSFSITANEISNIPEAVKVILRDNITLAETDLTDGTASYSFTPETTSTDRFSLIFRSAGATTGLGNTQDDDLLVYYNNGLSIICNNDKLIGSMVSVYNGVGQLMISKEISAKNMKFNESFAPGVYVVKTKSISKKVIVK